MPLTPSVWSALTTSSNLCGFTTAVISFMVNLRKTAVAGNGADIERAWVARRSRIGEPGRATPPSGCLRASSDPRAGVLRLVEEVIRRERLALEHEVRVAVRPEFVHVDPVDLGFAGDPQRRVVLDDGEDHPRDPPGPDEAHDRTDELGHELACIPVEEALHVAGHPVPARAVGAVGKEPDREDPPEPAHAVDRDRAT